MTSTVRAENAGRDDAHDVLKIVLNDPPRAVQRSTAPADVLSRRLNSVCTTAIDPLEIAAAIEAEGVNDKMAVNGYDKEDVFALAEEIYERVPLRPSTSEVITDTDDAPAWRELSRGFLFVLPGTMYIAAVQGFSSTAATYALLSSLVFAWVWGQGSGYIGHLLIGRRADRSARRFVLWMSAVGIVIATATSWALAFFSTLSMEIVAVSSAQTTYLLAAGVLLLFRKEFVLFAILVPGASAALVLLMTDRSISEPVAVNVVIITTVGAAAIAAIVTTRKVENLNPGILTFHDVMGTVPHMALGLVWASLVSLSVLITIAGRNDEPLLGLTIVPLLLSMGVAEWSLRHYLRVSRRELQKITDPLLFASTARTATLKTVGGYTAMLAVLTAAAAFLIYFVGTLTLRDALMLISYAQLGAAFLLGQMLTSRSRVTEALVLSSIAFTMLIALIGYLGVDDLAFAYVASTMFLAVSLLARTLMTAGHVTAYR